MVLGGATNSSAFDYEHLVRKQRSEGNKRFKDYLLGSVCAVLKARGYGRGGIDTIEMTHKVQTSYPTYRHELLALSNTEPIVNGSQACPPITKSVLRAGVHHERACRCRPTHSTTRAAAPAVRCV